MVRARRGSVREAEYRELVSRQAKSGLSVGEFADLEGIPIQTFYWWRSELRRRDRLRPLRPEADTCEFVEVAAPPPHGAPSGDGFEVRLPGGVEVEIACGFDEDELARLLRVLRRRC